MPLPFKKAKTSLRSRAAFTLIELLIVIAIIAVLATVVILALNPAELMRQARDSNRVSDLATLNQALTLYSGDVGSGKGSSSVIYVSVPDPTATSSAGTDCSGIGLASSSLPAGWSWHCAASSTYRDTGGTGWIPVDFKSSSFGSPMGTLPVDPTNSTSSGLYYTYLTNGSQYEMTAMMESSRFEFAGSKDVVSTDGGYIPYAYETGTSLTLGPYVRNLLLPSGTDFEGDFEGSNDGFSSYNGGATTTFGWTSSYGSITGSDAEYVQVASTQNCCNYGGINANIVPTLTVGQRYAVSVYAKSIANAGPISIMFVQSNGDLSGTCLNFSFTPTAQWEPYSSTCTLTTSNGPTLYFISTVPSQQFVIDDLQLLAAP